MVFQCIAKEKRCFLFTEKTNFEIQLINTPFRVCYFSIPHYQKQYNRLMKCQLFGKSKSLFSHHSQFSKWTFFSLQNHLAPYLFVVYALVWTLISFMIELGPTFKTSEYWFSYSIFGCYNLSVSIVFYIILGLTSWKKVRIARFIQNTVEVFWRVLDNQILSELEHLYFFFD